jgi:hypothetical protein
MRNSIATLAPFDQGFDQKKNNLTGKSKGCDIITGPLRDTSGEVPAQRNHDSSNMKTW